MIDIDYDKIIQTLPYNSSMVKEINQNGKTNNYIKIILSVKDLRFSNWFNFTEKQRLMAESDSKHIVIIDSTKYLKTYRIIEDMPINEDEQKYGRIIMNINKRLYPDGFHYYVRKVYPRPKFLKTMYGMNLSNLDWISKDITKELINIYKSLEPSKFDFSHHVENENLVVKIKLQ